MAQRRLFAPFLKIDEEKREVAGRLTQEVVDRDGEIWDYAASVPHVKAWSESFEKATDGLSCGNLRAMHQAISAGKLVSIVYNDDEKAIDIVAKVVDDAEWEKTKEGVYTGFSIGGRVVRSWRNPDEKNKRFEVKPIEASLADLPCVPTATFDYVKVGGATETRHFTKTSESPMSTTAKKPTTFADAPRRRFPIDTKPQTQLSIAAWTKTAAREQCTSDEQTAIVAALASAAATHGLVGVTPEVITGAHFAKGLYDVSRFCDLIQSLAYLQQSSAYEREYEGDDSTVPDSITDAIASLVASLEAMVGEEGDELLRMLGFEAPKAAVAGATSTKTADASGDGAVPPVVAAVVPAEHVETPPVTSEKVDTPAPASDATGEPAAAPYTKAMAKKHVAKLKDLHQAAQVFQKMATDHCEKLAGMIADAEGSGEADDDASEKIASADFQKVAGERDTWEKRAKELEANLADVTARATTAETERDSFQKTAAELALAGQEMMAALDVRKGQLVAVDRTSDGAAALTPPPAADAVQPTTEKVAVPTEYNAESTLLEFKKALRKPKFTTV